MVEGGDARRTVTAAAMTASEKKLGDSHRLIAAGLLIIARLDARRTASGPSQLSHIEPDDYTLAEVLPALIRFREVLSGAAALAAAEAIQTTAATANIRNTRAMRVG